MADPLYSITFEAVGWSTKESAAQGVAEAIAVYTRKHGQAPNVLLCSSANLPEVEAAAVDLGLPVGTQKADTVIWTRTLVPARQVWAGRKP